MVLVDTSAFIRLLRGERFQSLEVLIVSGHVKLSQTVLLELVQGVRKTETRALERFLDVLGDPLPWPRLRTCKTILSSSRMSGIRVGVPDVMILADAIDHSCRLMTLDNTLRRLAEKAKVPLIY